MSVPMEARARYTIESVKIYENVGFALRYIVLAITLSSMVCHGAPPSVMLGKAASIYYKNYFIDKTEKSFNFTFELYYSLCK